MMTNREFKALLALDVIKNFQFRCFTARELAAQLGVSYDTALNRLKALYQMGLVSFYEVEYSSHVKSSYKWFEISAD